MTDFLTDNRYAKGASGAVMPATDDVVAAYSARWIDRGSHAEILGDRQGFAYDRTDGRDLLIQRLAEAALQHGLPYLATDVSTDVTPTGMGDAEWTVCMRRCGGYIYVDAWLYSEEYVDAMLAEADAEGPSYDDALWAATPPNPNYRGPAGGR